MARRLGRAASAVGVADPGPLLSAHSLAMGPRERLLADDHHPHMLHPGRTALILLHDVGMRDPALLAAGVLLESVVDELRVDRVDVHRTMRMDVVELVDLIPNCDAERLTEELLGLEGPLLEVALAEHLDHLRHARLWGDPRARAVVEQRSREVYGRLAERAHPKLAGRYRAWQRLTEREDARHR